MRNTDICIIGAGPAGIFTASLGTPGKELTCLSANHQAIVRPHKIFTSKNLPTTAFASGFCCAAFAYGLWGCGGSGDCADVSVAGEALASGGCLRGPQHKSQIHILTPHEKEPITKSQIKGNLRQKRKHRQPAHIFGSIYKKQGEVAQKR